MSSDSTDREAELKAALAVEIPDCGCMVEPRVPYRTTLVCMTHQRAAAAIRKAVLAEREACAQMCEAADCSGSYHPADIAAAIRARKDGAT